MRGAGTSGIRRTGGHANYDVVRVTNSSDVTVRDLTFDEDAATLRPSCRPFLSADRLRLCAAARFDARSHLVLVDAVKPEQRW